EGAVMQLGQTLGDGQAESGAAFGGLMRERALAEALQYARDLVFGNARAGVLHAQELTAGAGAPDLQRDGAARGGELDGVGEQVEADLADGALVGPKLRQVFLERLDDLEPLALRPQPHQPVTILDQFGEIDGRLVQFVAAGLDAAAVQNVVYGSEK